GATATRAFFEKAVAFAKARRLVLVQDAAYAALPYDGRPLSILSVPGAKDVAVELHSLSKSHNMTGWRIGFVAGAPWLVRAYADVKDNTDSGQFLAIQKAAAAALDDVSIPRQIAAKYARRFDRLLPVLRAAGFPCERPRAGFFLYTAAPKKAVAPDGSETAFAKAADFSDWLIQKLLISTVPWDDAGAFVRFSATFQASDEPAERAVADELSRRLSTAKLVF
ncbi:MAG: aminotransferase class I/II-fold pyridoxal phosphate-dependent enzyme, partial [Opitutaceae bacterium]|nr:aminotransferase class I/II-fold pyridoxal phosphate-dependent enzyme [Opitutaceae bacterium]